MSFISGYMFSSHRSPAFVFSHRRVQSGFCDHSGNWTSSSLGNDGVGTEAPLLFFNNENRSVTDYSIEFRTLAAECKWNYEAQWDMFRHGLADRIINEIYTQELPTSLDGLIDLAIRVDTRLQRRGQRALQMPVVNTEDRFSSMATGAVGHVFDSEPMQVGRAHLSREEKERRRNQGLCFYCGAAGHIAAQCPVKAKARQ